MSAPGGCRDFAERASCADCPGGSLQRLIAAVPGLVGVLFVRTADWVAGSNAWAADSRSVNRIPASSESTAG